MTPLKSPTPLAAGILGGAAAGALLTGFVLIDPLGLRARWAGHSQDSHGAHTPVARAAAEPAHQHAAAELFTCGMHPDVVQESPGICPICQMDLVPLRAEASAAEGEREVLFYRHPMDPTITSPVPAQDEMGMDYVPVHADDEGARGGGTTVTIDPGVVQNMNVRIETVERRDLVRPIRTVGYLDYDQERMVTVTTKYSGFVEKVYVNHVGERVEAGQPLFEIYAPELVQTERELLSALELVRDMTAAADDSRRRAQALVEAARTRLGYWDIDPEQIAHLEATGEVFRTLQVRAPAKGLVMKRLAGLEGMAVRPGMEIFHIADLSSLWLAVEVYEHQMAWIREGLSAEVTLTYYPGRVFRGQVRFIEPELSEATRTLRVKIEVPNARGELRKGMFATVRFAPLAVADAVAVPSQAVLRTGERNVVVTALGEGRFAPREVVLGHEAEGYVQILEGLEAGEQIVTSAHFLLDSESTLRTAVQKMIAARRAADPAPAAQDPAGHQHHDHHPPPEPAEPDPSEHHHHPAPDPDAPPPPHAHHGGGP